MNCAPPTPFHQRIYNVNVPVIGIHIGEYTMRDVETHTGTQAHVSKRLNAVHMNREDGSPFIHSFRQSVIHIHSFSDFISYDPFNFLSYPYHIHIISYFVKIRTVLTNLHRVAATPSPLTLASPTPLPRPRSQQRRKRRKRRRRKKKRKRISSTHARSIGRQETRGRVKACH